MKQKFLEIYKKHITRPGSEELLAYLEKSDFFRAPASHKYHLSIPGGLVIHSVGVYNRLRELFLREKELKNDFTELTPEQEETIAICGLLHDLCKIDFYQQVKKSRKTGRLQPNGKPEWEDYYGYDIEEKLVYPESDFENLCPNCGAQVFTKQSFPFQNVCFEKEGIPVKINEHGNLEDL